MSPRSEESPRPATPTPTARTRLLALLGDPVAHSLSPAIQNAAARAAGLDAVYVALRCGEEDVRALLTGIARAGGAGNVTVPHKLHVVAALQRSTEAVVRTSACNTFWLEDDRVCGDNTDVAGFRAAAEALIGDCAGARVLLLGAGGAARAAAVALGSARAGRVVVIGRSPARTESFIRELAPAVPRMHTAQHTGADAYDLVVNATPLGLSEADPLPLDLSALRVGAVLDLVYAPGGTPWTRYAARLGIPAVDGSTMLLAQGVAAFERWWQRPAPLDAMRTALDRALAEHVPADHGHAPPPTPT